MCSPALAHSAPTISREMFHQIISTWDFYPRRITNYFESGCDGFQCMGNLIHP